MKEASQVRRACVLGAGTMGAAIAALLANAGLEVDLLDAVPESLTPAEQAIGKTLADRAVRNRLVQAGFERARAARPRAFANDEAIQRVRLGNVEDDFGRVSEAGWVVEAIVEDLAAKQALLARVESAANPQAIVSSNTSGIPIGLMAQGRSAAFRARFLGTHFFNPPRYLRLLEIIPTSDTAPEVAQFMADFGARTLGKGVVICKDTPNFIANRLTSIGSSFLLDYAIGHGYTVEEVDLLTGELIGRPRTATFRLFDLVGLDVAMSVRRNLYDRIPHDEGREVLRSPHMARVASALLERGWLGNKTGQGFYKAVQVGEGREFWPLNLQTLEYEPPQYPRFEAVDKAEAIQALGPRLDMLLQAADRAGDLIRAVVYHGLAYASQRVPEIADEISAIDHTLQWGFNHQAGPFQLWDGLGVALTLERMEAAGYRAAPWVHDMLALGCASFYRWQDGQVVGEYDPAERNYVPLPQRS